MRPEAREREWPGLVKCMWAVGSNRWCKEPTHRFVAFDAMRMYRCAKHEARTIRVLSGSGR